MACMKPLTGVKDETSGEGHNYSRQAEVAVLSVDMA